MSRTDITHARHHRELAMMPIFRPLRRGERNIKRGIDIRYGIKGGTVHLQSIDLLGIDDQSIFFVLLALAGIERNDRGLLPAVPSGPIGKDLRSKIRIDGLMDDIQKITTSEKELAGYLEIHGTTVTWGRIREGMKRLQGISFHYSMETGEEYGSNLLSWHKDPEGKVHVAFNPLNTFAILSQHVRIDLTERKMIETEWGKAAHAWLCSWLRPGKENSILPQTLGEHVWSHPASKNESRKRLWKMRKFLKEELSKIGWSAEENEEGIFKILRPK